MSLVELKNISKIYQMDKVQVRAVDDVSFTIEKGEFVAISGPSGSGKSTLLNIIGLTDLPNSGSVILDGTDIYQGIDLTSTKTIPLSIDSKLTDLRRQKLGFVFQTFNLIPVLNVYENIEFPLLLESKNKDLACPVDSFTKKQKEEWIHYLMEKTGLTDWEKHKPSELSGGQRQRVAIARALVTKAPVILADEPTANLDSVNSSAILSLMKDLNRDPELQTTFIFSTHDSRIVEMCDHVVHIFDGNIKNDEHKTGSDVYNVESK
jgi:putative ABC transport system ATP-binding protein